MAKVVKIIDRKYYDYVAEVVKDGKNYVARCDGQVRYIFKRNISAWNKITNKWRI